VISSLTAVQTTKTSQAQSFTSLDKTFTVSFCPYIKNLQKLQ